MRLPRRGFLTLASGFAALPFASRLASAEAYPSKPVRLLVGFPAGGQVDIIARLTGQALGDRIGQTVVVENKPGAGGNLGAQALIGSPPDGYTLFFGTAANAINMTLFANLPYDFAHDIAPVAPVNRIPLLLQVNPSFPAKNTAEFLAYAKANPGKVNIASPSAGTPPYLCVDLLKMMTGIDVTHVPYVGESQMLTDLLGGQVLAAFGGISPSVPHVKAGKLRALGVTTAARIAELPDIPTIAEAGVPGFEAVGWTLVCAPAATPKPILDTLSAAFAAAAETPEVHALMLQLGTLPVKSESPAELKPWLASEIDRWGKLVERAGVAKSL